MILVLRFISMVVAYLTLESSVGLAGDALPPRVECSFDANSGGYTILWSPDRQPEFPIGGGKAGADYVMELLFSEMSIVKGVRINGANVRGKVNLRLTFDDVICHIKIDGSKSIVTMQVRAKNSQTPTTRRADPAGSDQSTNLDKIPTPK
jgi:hypothetical protein